MHSVFVLQGKPRTAAGGGKKRYVKGSFGGVKQGNEGENLWASLGMLLELRSSLCVNTLFYIGRPVELSRITIGPGYGP
jgi:hypothetical protein